LCSALNFPLPFIPSPQGRGSWVDIYSLQGRGNWNEYPLGRKKGYWVGYGLRHRRKEGGVYPSPWGGKIFHVFPFTQKKGKRQEVTIASRRWTKLRGYPLHQGIKNSGKIISLTKDAYRI